jgi:hypothetical protein
VVRHYWRPVAREQNISLADAVAELDARLSTSVQSQLVSDVPLGAFLSGGLDSASVVHAMRKAGPVRTFSMGFTEASFDESDDAGDYRSDTDDESDGKNDDDSDLTCGDLDSCEHDAENDADSDTLCGDVDSCVNDAENDSDSDELLREVRSWAANDTTLNFANRPVNRHQRVAKRKHAQRDHAELAHHFEVFATQCHGFVLGLRLSRPTK